MVYKIRNTGFFMTKSGFKNNYYPQVSIGYKYIGSDQVQAVRDSNLDNYYSYTRRSLRPNSSGAELPSDVPPRQAVLLRRRVPRGKFPE